MNRWNKKKGRWAIDGETAMESDFELRSCPPPQLVSEIPGHRDRIMSEPYVFVQPKLDGWCCMANTVTRKIYTRRGAEITTLPHINAALPVDGPEWLHGELWKTGANCDDIQSMVKRGSDEVELHVFDCVSDEGFGARIENLQRNVKIEHPIVLVEWGIFSIGLARYTWASQGFGTGTDDLIDYFQRKAENAPNEGYEGLIIRLDGHGYYHGRSVHVFKMKPGTEGW